MSQFSPEKSSYLLMQTPTFMHPNKTFTIMGFITDILLEIDFTKISVLVITFRNKDEVREMFESFFMGDTRLFIDKFARTGDLAHITGELIISKESTDDLKIIKLVAKHVYLYRKMGMAYEQISELIKAAETESDDLAF